MNDKSRHGGARKGAGRKTADGATGLVRVNMTICAKHRDKLEQLGGSVWLRKMIEQADER